MFSHAHIRNPKLHLTPRSFRHSFALRYLQAGGNPRGLQELLGYAGPTQIKLYLRCHDQLVHDRTQNRADEETRRATPL